MLAGGGRRNGLGFGAPLFIGAREPRPTQIPRRTSTGTGDTLYFVAGLGASSGNYPYTVTVSGTQSANKLIFQSSGPATFSATSGTINLWSSGITVSQYAYGTTAQGAVTISVPISLQALGTQTFTNDSSNPLTVSGVISGSTGLAKSGSGTLILTGANTYTGTTTVSAGTLTLASSGSLNTGTGTSKDLRVGNTGPAAMTIQDNGSVSVGGKLYVNYNMTTPGSPSTLTLTSGSLSVTQATVIGSTAMRADPSVTSAAFYQSGGAATLSGLVTVGNAGTATSLYDINGGALDANGGLEVGNQGNGHLTIHGSADVEVRNGQGLVIGKDSNRATSGRVDFAGGSLSVTGDLKLGSSKGIGTFSRSGGTTPLTGNKLTTGDLVAGGTGTLILDATGGSVATKFGGSLRQENSGTLVVIPYTGDLGSTEAVSFGTAPTVTNGIIGPWLVRQTSASDTSGNYLTTSGNSLTSVTYPEGDFDLGTHSTNGGMNVKPSGTQTPVSSKIVNSLNLTDIGVTINSGNTLTLNSGGIIVNGVGGNGAMRNAQDNNSFAGPITLASNTQISAAANTQLILSGTLQSITGGSYALTKAGGGTVVLSGNTGDLYDGTITVAEGTLTAQNAGALGKYAASNGTTVNYGATLAIQGGISVQEPLTISGAGSTTGAIRSIAGANVLSGPVTLAADSQVNVEADSLNLTGKISGGFGLTKAGPGILQLSGSDNDFTGTLAVLDGTVSVATVNNSGIAGPLDASGSSNGALTNTSGVIIGAGATLRLTAGGTTALVNQLPDAANVSLGGGTLECVGNGGLSGGEDVGALILNAGQNNVTTSRQGSTTYTPYLRFGSGPPSHTTGATVNFYAGTSSAIQFRNRSRPGVRFSENWSGHASGFWR